MTVELRADDDERAVVGILIRAPDLVSEARRLVTSADFAHEGARAVFAAIEAVDDAGEPSIYTNVWQALRRRGQEQRVGLDFLVWAAEVPSSAFLSWHCVNVARAAQRRRLVVAGTRIGQVAQDPGLNADEAVRAAQEIVESVGRRRASGAEILEPFELSVLVSQRLAAIRSGEDDSVLPFGLTDLDTATGGGARPGQLVVVGGRPGMGKSALLRAMARSMARKGWVLYASNEMSPAELGFRDVAVLADVPLPTVVKGSWAPVHDQRIQSAFARIAETRIVTDYDGSMTSAGLRARALSLHARSGLVAVVVDYIQRMADPGHTSLERVGYTVRTLKSLACELGVPVIAGSQLSRAGERENQASRPTLIDLRETGEIEQEADIVILLYRAAYYWPTREAWESDPRRRGKAWPADEAELIIAKQRNGISGATVRVTWRPTVAAFVDRRSEDDSRF